MILLTEKSIELDGKYCLRSEQKKETKGSLFSKHTPQIYRKKKKERKKQAILHKKYCSLIHQNVLYKIRTLESNSQCTCRNQGQTDEKKNGTHSYCE
jgi:hypothetical protein